MVKVALVIKLIQVLSAVLLVAASVIRVGTVANLRSFTGFMLTGYLFLFAVVFLCVEFALFRAPVWFYWLNFTWGKAIAYLVIGALEFWSGFEIAFIDVIAGLWFAIFGVAFIIMWTMYRSVEHENVEAIIAAVEAGENQAKAEAGAKALAGAAGAGATMAKDRAEQYRTDN